MRAAAGHAGAGSGRGSGPLFLYVLKDDAGQQHGQSHPMAEDAREQFPEGQPLSSSRAGHPSKLHPRHLSLPGLRLSALKGHRSGSEGQLLGLLVLFPTK